MWYNLDTRETYIKSIDNKFAVNNGFGYAVLRSENHNVKAITQKFINCVVEQGTYDQRYLARELLLEILSDTPVNDK